MSRGDKVGDGAPGEVDWLPTQALRPPGGLSLHGHPLELSLWVLTWLRPNDSVCTP